MESSMERQLADAARWRAGIDLSSAEFELVVELHTDHRFETAPHRLWEAFEAGRATTPVLAVMLPETWRYKLDDCTLPRAAWRQMFQAVPYSHDGRAAQPPRRARRLYRGATREHRDGLSWTSHYAIAEYFARSRQTPGTIGTVWQCDIDPARLHAHIPDEHEYVADVRGLPITERGFVPPRLQLLGLLRR